MEVDPEMKGSGNSYTTEFRQYDPRLGRWLSLDPLAEQFPHMSPYVAFDDNPVVYTDPEGLAASGGEPYVNAWAIGWRTEMLVNTMGYGFGSPIASEVFPGDLYAQKAFLEGQMAADIFSIGLGDITITMGGTGLEAAGALAVNVEGAIVTEPAALVTAVGSLVLIGAGAYEVWIATDNLSTHMDQYNHLMNKMRGQSAKKVSAKPKKNPKAEGIIYERTNPKTGEKYYGQAKNAKAFENRKKAHDKKHGVEHKYRVVERGKPGKELDVKEENWIRQNGGPNNGRSHQGTLGNRRHQMNDKNYEKNGGTVEKPSTSSQGRSHRRGGTGTAKF